MPFGIHKHSNRSKQALNDPIQGDTSSGPSRSDSSREDFDETQTQVYSTPRPESYTQSPAPVHDPRLQQQKPVVSPTRSQSARYPSPYHQQQAFQPHPSGSAAELVVDARYQQQEGPPTLQPPVAEPAKKSKGFFDRMRSGSSRSEPKPPPPSQSSYNNTAGLARRLSKKEAAPPIRTGQQRNSVEVQNLDWQDPRSLLPSPHKPRNDDSGLDPYLIREDKQEIPHSIADQIQHPTIRAVQGDSEAPLYPVTGEQRQQFEVQQLQQQQQQQQQQLHLREQAHQQYLESQQYYQLHHQGQPQPQPPPHLNISRPSLVTSESYPHPNPETVSQLSFESPVDQQEQRPVSGQSNGQSPTSFSTPRQIGFPHRTSSIPLQQEVQQPQPQPQYDSMPPPPGGNAAGRRTAEAKPTSSQGQGQQEPRDGPPPNYSRGQFANNQPPAPGLSPLPPAGGTQAQTYRGGPPQRDQFNPQGEQGRNTPPPPPPGPSTQDVSDNYKELLTKYKKVKGLYFEKTAQVEQLQNTLANQRLSQSRTSLDDSEYMTRFQRLEGAITNLAFNIRKDWRIIPAWLTQWVNQDASKIGKQEMTAVGRACITKFIVDEIFNRTFHPGLEGGLSSNLKNIEKNIRLFSPALNNQEESEVLTAKVVQWRLATLEGLKDVLTSPESEEYKKQFAQVATTNLTASLINFLQEPVPPGIEDSAHMIVELAVNIACNLPLESRDISIVHPMPGDMLQPVIMKIENPIPALENPGMDIDDAESTNSGDKDSEKEEKEGGKLRKSDKKPPGMLQAMMGGNSSSGKKGGEVVEKKISNEDGAQKVRFAGFVGVEVRGRQVLVKAPVWTVS